MQFIRTKPLAATFFGAIGQGTQMTAIPRYKFMYYANFKPSDAALKRFPNLKNLGNYENGISFKIHGIDRPNVEFNVTELNQYNRKRYAYTKVEYQPLNIKIYDTVDNIPLTMWAEYFGYYFGDMRSGQIVNGQKQKNDSTYTQSVIDPTFDFSTGWGFNPVSETTNFFDKIELYAIYGGDYLQINYINPKITKFDFQNYDSSSSDPAEISITVRYETLEYIGLNKITAQSGNGTFFGFDIDNALEPRGVQVPLQRFGYAAGATVTSVLSELQYVNALLPTDLVNGVSSVLQVANSTLGIFNQSPITALSRSGATVLGQANQYLNTTNAAFNTVNQLTGSVAQAANTPAMLGNALGMGLTTNPSATPNFLGTGYSQAPNPVSSTLNQYGAFNFGNSPNYYVQQYNTPSIYQLNNVPPNATV